MTDPRALSVVLGIDPGTAVTGFGVVAAGPRGTTTGMELVACGAIRTSRGRSLHHRLYELHLEVGTLIDHYSPTAMSLESAFHGPNARSALTLGQARGAIVVAAVGRGLAVAEYAPAQIKRAVAGSGAATKEQVAFMVRSHLGLAADPTPSDAADGVAAALCHHFRAPLAPVGGVDRPTGARRVSP